MKISYLPLSGTVRSTRRHPDSTTSGRSSGFTTSATGLEIAESILHYPDLLAVAGSGRQGHFSPWACVVPRIGRFALDCTDRMKTEVDDVGRVVKQPDDE
jgi:hypothetical protein